MALSVGTVAPNFTLLNADREPVTLHDLRGKKVVLAFFPAAFTGVCQAELCTFQDSLGKLHDANAEVLGISADLPFSNKAFATANAIKFPILSDWDLSTINAYDVALANFAGIDGLTRSVRATFVLDADGVIQFAEVTENPGVEPNYEAVFAAVNSL